MTSLDFLYIALGGGFLILVIFFSVLILQLILILRDFNKVTENAKEVSGRVKQIVFEPLEFLSEISSGWKMMHNLIEKIRDKFDSESEENVDEDKNDDKNDKKFKVKKLSRW
ncbi:hypothetical protein GF376_01985 [Candidatus Peregrinibacteria bacterium]|nr:hypothetical protein [Candidatus Peregrinibacteria bacterium]